jgi:hypothetical protein
MALRHIRPLSRGALVELVLELRRRADDERSAAARQPEHDQLQMIGRVSGLVEAIDLFERTFGLDPASVPTTTNPSRVRDEGAAL